MRHSTDYVWEKMYLALSCLCGEGAFKERLEGAAVSMVRLSDDDVNGELAEDLEYIFSWTSKNIKGGKLVREPGHADRKKLVEKMLHVLIATTERQGEKEAVGKIKRHQRN